MTNKGLTTKKNSLFIGSAMIVLVGAVIPLAALLGEIRSHVITGPTASLVKSEPPNPAPVLQQSVYHLVYVESEGSQSAIWVAAPEAGEARREQILTVSHAQGYPITATLSPRNDCRVELITTSYASPL